MKLKKIASLMLAGIMAVSMLAGCKGNTIKDDPSSSEDNSQATSVSATLYGKFSDATQSKLKYADDADLTASLIKNVGSVGYDNLANAYNDHNLTVATYVDEKGGYHTGNVAAGLIKDLESKNVKSSSLAAAIGELNPTAANEAEKSINVVLLYVVNNGVAVENALAAIANQIDGNVKGLQVDNDEVNGSASALRYNYTVSVSTTTKTDEANHGKGLTFIAVELTRTLAQA